MSEIRYCPEIATLLIDFPSTAVDLDSTKQIAGAIGLNQKHEFHVTIIGNNTGQELLRSFQKIKLSDKCVKLIEIGEFAALFDWEMTFKPEAYLIQKQYPNKELRTSLIQVVECPDIVPFYEELSEISGIKFELPYLHATLFTTSTDKRNKNVGIGIYSMEDFYSLNPQRLLL